MTYFSDCISVLLVRFCTSQVAVCVRERPKCCLSLNIEERYYGDASRCPIVRAGGDAAVVFASGLISLPVLYCTQEFSCIFIEKFQ
jgi:hypothetical protein